MIKSMGRRPAVAGRLGLVEFVRVLVFLLVAVHSAALSATPGEVSELRWCSGTLDCLEWNANADANRYTVYRGHGNDVAALSDSAVDSSYAGVFTSNTTGELLIGTPPVGDFYWYLVTAANDEGEGPAGATRTLNVHGTSCGDRALVENFNLVQDGSPWPEPFTAAGGVDVADIQSGAARFRPIRSPYSLARFHAPLPPVGDTDIEVLFTFMFEDTSTQGVGFYLRANGGYLVQTNPPGQGYGVFVEGHREEPGIGLWKEINGQETPMMVHFDSALGFENGVRYRVRFRLHQSGPTRTLLRARVWPEGGTEPETWHVELSDFTTPELQGVFGDLTVDSWSSNTVGSPIPEHTFVDDIEVVRLCNPLAGYEHSETLEESFAFTAGPLWHGEELLFTDLLTNMIFTRQEPGPATVWRAPSNVANGLAHDINGDVLAAEHETRRITRTDATGAVSTVVDYFEGLRFNSPNDLTVRQDGTIYFTDPPYGLFDLDTRELPFNGLFRLSPQGTIVAEWSGDALTTGPNGVVLSPGQDLLYMTDSENGQVLRWDVASDGSLSGVQTLVSGLNFPDGMTTDRYGNLYVATFSSTVEVLDPDGERWGTIFVPRQATNCTFGDGDRRTLYITAHEGLYRVRLALPGPR